MKITTKMKTFLAAALAGVALAAAPVRAFNLNDAWMGVLGEGYDSRYVTMLSTTPGNGNEQTAIKLFYVGTATEAVVTVDSTGVTFYAPNNVLDTTFTNGKLLATTYTTIGALCDAINTSSKYQCRMEDARRSDAIGMLMGSTAASGVFNLKSVGGFAVAFTTASNSTNANVNQLSIGINPPPGNRVILKSCTFNANSNASVQFSVSGVKRLVENAPDGVVRNDGTIVWLSSASANTATTLTWDSSGIGGITFAAGYQGIPGPATGLPAGGSTAQPSPPNTLGRVVIRAASDAGTTFQTSGNSLYCRWAYRSTAN